VQLTSNPWVFAELYRKTPRLEVLNAELERRVEERTAERDHAKEQLPTKRVLAFARRQDLQPEVLNFYASRADSVHATLMKPALSFCSRCEALAAPSSQRCPPRTAAASASNMARRGAKAVKGHTVASTFDNDNMEKLVE
jgi:hypothetical protein